MVDPSLVLYLTALGLIGSPTGTCLVILEQRGMSKRGRASSRLHGRMLCGISRVRTRRSLLRTCNSCTTLFGEWPVAGTFVATIGVLEPTTIKSMLLWHVTFRYIGKHEERSVSRKRKSSLDGVYTVNVARRAHMASNDSRFWYIRRSQITFSNIHLSSYRFGWAARPTHIRRRRIHL
jgi:hypothetical protein